MHCCKCKCKLTMFGPRIAFQSIDRCRAVAVKMSTRGRTRKVANTFMHYQARPIDYYYIPVIQYIYIYRYIYITYIYIFHYSFYLNYCAMSYHILLNCYIVVDEQIFTCRFHFTRFMELSFCCWKYIFVYVSVFLFMYVRIIVIIIIIIIII